MRKETNLGASITKWMGKLNNLRLSGDTTIQKFKDTYYKCVQELQRLNHNLSDQDKTIILKNALPADKDDDYYNIRSHIYMMNINSTAEAGYLQIFFAGHR